MPAKELSYIAAEIFNNSLYNLLKNNLKNNTCKINSIIKDYENTVFYNLLRFPHARRGDFAVFYLAVVGYRLRRHAVFELRLYDSGQKTDKMKQAP